MHTCTRERKENCHPPAQEAFSSRGGGGVGRQGQPVMSQEVAGTEGSGRLKGDRRAFREGNRLPSCLWSLPLSWLDPDSDKGWEETAHVLVSRRGNLFSTFCGRRKHLEHPDASATSALLCWSDPRLLRSGRCQRSGGGACGGALRGSAPVIQQCTSLGFGLTTDTHSDLERDPRHLFLLNFLLVAASIQENY